MKSSMSVGLIYPSKPGQVMQGCLEIAVVSGLVKCKDIPLCGASIAVVNAGFQVDGKIWGIVIIVEWTKGRGLIAVAIFQAVKLLTVEGRNVKLIKDLLFKASWPHSAPSQATKARSRGRDRLGSKWLSSGIKS
jgi:hypothetical protein